MLGEADAARQRMRKRRAAREGSPSQPASERSTADADDIEDAEVREAAAEPEPEEPTFDDVFAWQPLVLNRSSLCAGCSASLERGERVLVAITESGMDPETILCASCSPSSPS